MSGIGNEVQVEEIIERYLDAVEARRALRDKHSPERRGVLASVPTWFTVAVPIIVALIGFGSLRSDVATAKSTSETNKDAIGVLDNRLSSMETDIKWLVAERKREQ